VKIENMENKYKEFIVSRLYGLMEGSPQQLESMIKDDFKIIFKHEPNSVNVTSTNRVIEDEYMKGMWIGTMTVTLIVNNEVYSLTRDFGEEYDNDKKHPNFKTDDWFYEGEDCLSWKKSQEILKSFNLDTKIEEQM
jgi:hypothetical protein